MKHEQERQRIVDVAKTWLGTPYHHMGRVKGAGCDCATILAEVYHEAGVIESPVQIDYYPMDWHMHRDDDRYLNIVRQYASEIETEPLPGDIVLYHFGRAWAHGAIVVKWPLVIHAVLLQPVSLADGLNDANLIGRKRRFFSRWSDEQ